MKALTIAIVLIGALTVAHAANLRAEIEASGKKIAAAMKKRDFATLSKEMKAGTTADFKYVEGGQSETLDQMLEHMKDGLGMMTKITTCSVKLLTLKEKGNTAVGTMRHTMAGTMKGDGKKTHSMTYTGVSEDTYVKQDGKWKMSSMTWKSQKQTIDGKPVPGMGQ
ncbi:MAG: nuclear transport factor 2 family protein [Fimbriimonadales bacterium]